MPMGSNLEAEILQQGAAPRKKRYMLFLFNKTDNSKDVKTIERGLDAAARGFIVLRTDDPDEALRLLLFKAVELVVVDSNFLPDVELQVEFAKELKQRKVCPILFVTNQEHRLIETYQKLLPVYEELDDYVLCPVDFVELSKRLKRMVSGDARAAKRFNVGAPVSTYLMTTEEMVEGVLVDLSAVGFSIRLNTAVLLRRGEQVRIRLPLWFFNIFHPQLADYMPFSGKVRRTSLDGSLVGCSIEWMTSFQREVLTDILTRAARKKRAAARNAGGAALPVKQS